MASRRASRGHRLPCAQSRASSAWDSRGTPPQHPLSQHPPTQQPHPSTPIPAPPEQPQTTLSPCANSRHAQCRTPRRGGSCPARGGVGSPLGPLLPAHTVNHAQHRQPSPSHCPPGNSNIPSTQNPHRDPPEHTGAGSQHSRTKSLGNRDGLQQAHEWDHGQPGPHVLGGKDTVSSATEGRERPHGRASSRCAGSQRMQE